MESLKLSKKLFDPLRAKWVAPTPEECIRQGLLGKMVEELGYPQSFIAVEKELSELPHLRLTSKDAIPNRRADVIVFAKKVHPDHPLYPLLMIECKAVPLTPKFAQQVIGYNSVVKAPFLALANQEQVMTGFIEGGHFHFEPGLPPYLDLKNKVRRIDFLTRI